MTLTIHIDGGSRGNPGPAGAGVSICDKTRRPVFEAGYWIGRVTNNVAEYQALLHALEAAGRCPDATLAIFTDSELLAHQINGVYRVRNPNIKPLYEQAVSLLAGFERWQVTHVRREHNQRADELANMAMDQQEDFVLVNELGDAVPAKRPARTRSKPAVKKSGSVPRVVVRCTRPPQAGTCSCQDMQNREFVFTETTPAGLCVHAAGLIIDTVIELQAGDGTGEETVYCPKPGCGAVFSVSVDK